MSDLIGHLREWARKRAALHHRFAVENEGLRTEHIASSAAYRELALEIEIAAPSIDAPKPYSETD